jgi:hypothetical protein
MPVDESSGVKQVIVQVPIQGQDCHQLPNVLGVDNAKFHWITPVQISAQYTGVPAPGFTFTIRPGHIDDFSGQWVDVWSNLHRVAAILVGGPHNRIVIGSELLSGNIPEEIVQAAQQVTVAFLVQYEDIHEDATYA